MDVGFERYLYEPEKADYQNIHQSGSAGDLSLDTESETVHNFRDQETCTWPSTRTTHKKIGR